MIFNMVGGGGGSGATLVVSSPANVSVTVSKDDKSYTKNSGSLGSATFKGLATGTWTVTISGNGQTATKTIVITADYAITIAFFSASINITYPATSTCVVTNSGGQTVASDTNTGSSTKTWTATVGATGTYTVTATATDGSGKSKSTTVSITADGQSSSVTLSYELYIFKAGTGSNTTWSTGGGTYGSSWTTNRTDYLIGVIGGFNGYCETAYLYANTAIDVTNYSKLIVTGYGVSVQSFGLSSSQGGSLVVSGDLGSSSSETTRSIDISSISGNMYFVIPSGGSYSTNLTFYITNIYVE